MLVELFLAPRQEAEVARAFAESARLLQAATSDLTAQRERVAERLKQPSETRGAA